MEIETEENGKKTSLKTGNGYYWLIGILLLAGIGVTVWREDIQVLLADETAPVSITGTWVAKGVPHISHRSTVHTLTSKGHFEGPTIIDRRIGNWRFEFVEEEGHFLTGKAHWDLTYPDGGVKHTGEGHISGVVLDEHWIHDGQHYVFLLEVPPHIHEPDTPLLPWIQVRFSLKLEDGKLTGYGMGSGLPSFFAATLELEKVAD